MYRFVRLVCFIGVVHSLCEQPNYPWTSRSGQQPGNTWKPNFESSAFEIAQGFITLDRKIQAFCHSFANNDLKETHGIDYYMLSLRIPNFVEDNISVQIKHRIIFVTVEDCTRTYADVKILPEAVDTKNALWRYSQDELLIRFPYKTSRSLQNTCGDFIEEVVFVVPKYTETWEPRNKGKSGWNTLESSTGSSGWHNIVGGENSRKKEIW